MPLFRVEHNKQTAWVVAEDYAECEHKWKSAEAHDSAGINRSGDAEPDDIANPTSISIVADDDHLIIGERFGGLSLLTNRKD